MKFRPAAVLAAILLLVQASGEDFLPLSDVKAGMQGEVLTVFRGTQPEAFSVEVSGVVQNAIGPGHSLILCQLTDPRVKDMGAAAGMSGSPLYIGGRFAGALSYQVQQFETVHYAGFTPAHDMAEVASRLDAQPQAADGRFKPLIPVFAMCGLSPGVAELMRPYLSALGLSVTSLGGSDNSATSSPSTPLGVEGPAIRPGAPVSVALVTGDITIGGTGTVSLVDGKRLTAFGHPMAGLGSVELPMCSADIITIIPSAMSSIKVANIGPVIGTITQDRLSAVSGLLGPGPAMIDVGVTVVSKTRPARNLRFSVARLQRIAPALVATGLTEAINGSNDAGLSDGFRIDSDIRYSPALHLASKELYAGPQSFNEGLGDFIKGLTQDLSNPYEKRFPGRIDFTVEALDENPAVTVDLFSLSQPAARVGDTVTAVLEWRDFEGSAHRDPVDIPIEQSWAGKTLEVIAGPGRAIDVLTGRPQVIATSQLRSFEAYIEAMRDNRPNDGLSVAVVETSTVFTDQAGVTEDLPGTIARIAAAADESRFQQHRGVAVLWERHLLSGKLCNTVVRRPLRISK